MADGTTQPSSLQTDVKLGDSAFMLAAVEPIADPVEGQLPHPGPHIAATVVVTNVRPSVEGAYTSGSRTVDEEMPLPPGYLPITDFTAS
jgi:hypothetical protein